MSKTKKVILNSRQLNLTVKRLSFEIIENGTHVICAVSGKEIALENLNYWNVELQEPYFSYVEANQKRDKDS